MSIISKGTFTRNEGMPSTISNNSFKKQPVPQNHPITVIPSFNEINARPTVNNQGITVIPSIRDQFAFQREQQRKKEFIEEKGYEDSKIENYLQSYTPKVYNLATLYDEKQLKKVQNYYQNFQINTLNMLMSIGELLADNQTEIDELLQLNPDAQNGSPSVGTRLERIYKSIEDVSSDITEDSLKREIFKSIKKRFSKKISDRLIGNINSRAGGTKLGGRVGRGVGRANEYVAVASIISSVEKVGLGAIETATDRKDSVVGKEIRDKFGVSAYEDWKKNNQILGTLAEATGLPQVYEDIIDASISLYNIVGAEGSTPDRVRYGNLITEQQNLIDRYQNYLRKTGKQLDGILETSKQMTQDISKDKNIFKIADIVSHLYGVKGKNENINNIKRVISMITKRNSYTAEEASLINKVLEFMSSQTATVN